jgi:hypothetical protein
VRKAVTKTVPSDIEEKIRKRARSKIKRELTNLNSHGRPVKRFIRAISCNGIYIAEQTLNTLCSRMCTLSSRHGLEQIFFHEIRKELQESRCPYYVCPNPLSPDLTECIILPEEQLCFIASHAAPKFNGSIRTIHLDKYLPKTATYYCSVREQLYEQLLSTAITHLQTAKRLHDDLELCYRPALDIKHLNEYTESVIGKLFQ